MRWIKRKWSTWMMVIDLRNDLRLHKECGFRAVLSMKNARDFYCSDPCCTVKHKVY